jgi:sugar phosphate isomerase/epimerase
MRGLAYEGSMNNAYLKLPYKIGAASMVFGEDLLENVRLLAELLDHIEIILFYTPSLHNIPGPKEIRTLREIGKQKDVTFTVHLPDSLEIASSDRSRRKESLELARKLCLELAEVDLRHYVLHIPFTAPTLVPVPDLYFNAGDEQDWDGWTKRALESLEVLHEGIGQGNKLLVENINYSPSFLEPFWEESFCEFCLDIGHLMLGQEDVMGVMKQYLDVARVIHLHGVRRYEEHLSLSIMPRDLLAGWLRYLKKASFQGVIVLEVFNPQDLEESIDILLRFS